MRYLLSFETTEPLDDLILPPDEEERWQRVNASEKVAYREPTGMSFGRNGYLYVFWCPQCPDYRASSDMQ